MEKKKKNYRWGIVFNHESVVLLNYILPIALKIVCEFNLIVTNYIPLSKYFNCILIYYNY